MLNSIRLFTVGRLLVLNLLKLKSFFSYEELNNILLGESELEFDRWNEKRPP